MPVAIAQKTPSQQKVIPGKALVKVKPEFKSLFQGGSTGRSAAIGTAIRPLAPGAATRKDGRAQAFKPVIDITQYFEVTFDPALPVAQYIQSLYATGYIEVAEPQYKQELFYTPNDPSAASQYYLQTIGAYDAWNITQGSEDIVIGIIDSGGDLDHPDLASQIYINPAEYPANGIDDDGNGYIDDYRGWDFAGADAANIAGDNDPSIKQNAPNVTHGTSVAGCASAATNNGVGLAGVGFKTKLLFTKHFADNNSSGSYNTDTYLGVLYAAQSGAKIINCSWGSNTPSAIYQDIITYVTQDLGCLVIAAAGNAATDARVYPASYDHVISVAASNEADKAAWYTTHNHAVDISAPGLNIPILVYDDGYSQDHGTSLAAPIVSGAAALLWAAHPEYTAAQVGEQLRVTANPVINQNSAELAGQIGKGRLDIYAALTQQSPSVRAANARITNPLGGVATPGDTALIYFDFTNYLTATSSALQITVTPTAAFGTALTSTIAPGAIGGGSKYTNNTKPFRVKTSNAIGENVTIELRLDYADGTYQDYQYITIVFNPTYINIGTNRIATTMTSTGRIGFGDTRGQSQGIGFKYNDTPMLYEMGLIMGSSTATILNNVRSVSANYDQDFVSTSPIIKITPGERSSSEVLGSFANSTIAQDQTVAIRYRSLTWTDTKNENLVILEYKIKNPTATPITNFYYGIFADWDISNGGAQDAAGWNAQTKTGYAYAKQNTSLPYAGLQLLTDNPQYYAIDNNQTIPGNPFGLYDGFTDAEKFTSISTSAKTEAGISVAAGTDVSHVLATGPYTIEPNAEITVAFALLAANNLNDLLATAKHADTVYNLALKAARPVAPAVAGCIGKDVTVAASGATTYAWYRDFTGGQPFATGANIIIPKLQRDTIVYVAATSNGYESIRTKVNITTTPNPTAAFDITYPSLFTGSAIQFTDKSTGAQTYTWNFGDNSSSTEQNPAHAYTTAGTFNITLTVTASNGCLDANTQSIAIKTLPPVITEIETQSLSAITLYPNPTSASTHRVIALNTESLSSKPLNITLSTPQGQQLSTTSITATSQHTLDISPYAPGLYIITLTSGTTTLTKKIIITP